jgi:hypothetical protein
MGTWKGHRRSLYARVAPSLWKAFAGDAAAQSMSQVELMDDILSGRYCRSQEREVLTRLPEYPGESRRFRVPLEVKVAPELWSFFTSEATDRGVSNSDHMEDLLAARYQKQQDKVGVVTRKSA